MAVLLSLVALLWLAVAAFIVRGGGADGSGEKLARWPPRRNTLLSGHVKTPNSGKRPQK